jgi:hypothetical protein
MSNNKKLLLNLLKLIFNPIANGTLYKMLRLFKKIFCRVNHTIFPPKLFCEKALRPKILRLQDPEGSRKEILAFKKRNNEEMSFEKSGCSPCCAKGGFRKSIEKIEPENYDFLSCKFWIFCHKHPDPESDSTQPIQSTSLSGTSG